MNRSKRFQTGFTGFEKGNPVNLVNSVENSGAKSSRKLVLLLFSFLISALSVFAANPAEKDAHVGIWERYPSMGIPLIETTPVIDGAVDPHEWFASACVNYLVDEKTGVKVDDKSSVRLAYSSTHFYMAFQFERPSHARIPSAEDLFEVDLDVHHDHKTIVAFAGNFEKIRWDAAENPQINETQKSHWNYKARVTDTGWEGELSVPFSDLGIQTTPATGSVWGINWVRREETPIHRICGWSYLGRFPPAYKNYGHIIFLGKPMSLALESVGWIHSPESGVIQKAGAVFTASNFSKENKALDVSIQLHKTQQAVTEEFYPAVEDAVTDDLGEPNGKSLTNEIQRVSKAYQGVKTVTQTVQLAAHTTRVVELSEPDEPGDYAASFLLKEGNEFLAGGTIPFKVPSPLGIQLKNHLLLSRAVGFEIDLRRLKDKMSPSSKLEVVARDAGGKVVGERRFENLDKKESVAGAFKFETVHSPNYQVIAKLLNGEKIVAERQVSVSEPPQESAPDWWKMKEGLEPLVPPPWTPVELRSQEPGARSQKSVAEGEPRQRREGGKQKAEIVSVLGREYEFDSLALPSQITTRDKQILAGPIEFKTAEPWKKSEVKLVSKKDDVVVLESESVAGNLMLKVRTQLEFDGFMYVDLDLTGNGTVDKLDLVIPFKKEHAVLMQNYRKASGPGDLGKGAGDSAKKDSPDSPYKSKRVGARFVGLIPEEKLQTLPMITTWIGTDHYGLEWSCESSRGWAMAKPDEAMEIKREGDKVVLTIHFISKPVALSKDKARRIRFGLVATPTKTVLPYLQKARMYDNYSIALLPGDWAGYPVWHPPLKNPEVIEKTRQWLQKGRQAGAKILVNGGWNISTQDPGWTAWGQEMVSEPMQNVSFGDAKQFEACYRTPYAEFLANSFGYNARLLKLDGIRFDTVVPSGECESLLHGLPSVAAFASPKPPAERGPAAQAGLPSVASSKAEEGCGWYDDDGKLWPSYSIFSQREIWKRLYRIFHGGVIAEGAIWLPTAAGPIMAVHSFSDVHEIGEGHYAHANTIKEGYPPDMVRANLVGEPYGFIPQNNLKFGPLFYNERIAALLVNGADPRFLESACWKPGYEAHAEPAIPIWDAWDWVDRGSAEWLGHWENSDYVRLRIENSEFRIQNGEDKRQGAEPESQKLKAKSQEPMILASFYFQKGKKLLLVVTNYETEPMDDLEVKLNLEKFGFKGPVYGEDAITMEPVSISTDGILNLDLFKQRYRLIKISQEPPRYREEVLGPNLVMDAPSEVSNHWASANMNLDTNSIYVLSAQLKIDKPLGEGSSNPNVMTKFSPTIKHCASIRLKGNGVNGINGINKLTHVGQKVFPKTGEENPLVPYRESERYQLNYLPQLWDKTPGWMNVFLPVGTSSNTTSGQFEVSVQGQGEARFKDLSLRKVK